MKPPWPVGTTFTVKTNSIEEVWTVDKYENIEEGIVGADTFFGKFLLGTTQGNKFWFKPDGASGKTYEIINIRVPSRSQPPILPAAKVNDSLQEVSDEQKAKQEAIESQKRK